MRIAVDAACWANGRGYGRFTREILGRLAALAPRDTFHFLLDPAASRAFDLEAPNARRVEVGVSESATRAAVAAGRRSGADLLRMTRAVARLSPDVFFSPSVYTWFPLPPGQRAVVCIHDVLPERHPELVLASRLDRVFWRVKMRMALRQTDRVLTVSEWSARRIAATLGVDPEDIDVTGEAPAAAYRPVESAAEIAGAARDVGLPPGARWFTYVGGYNPHKRVDVLVRAHARLTDGPGRAPYLLLVGRTGADGDGFHEETARIRETIRECGTEDRVVWTGFLPDETLRRLHAGAIALALPSEEEGFGLPAVEAAACGTPVVATARSPLPELLAGGGLFVEPGDVGVLAEALRTLASDGVMRRRMGLAARERAAALDWDEAARAALLSLRRAASPAPRRAADVALAAAGDDQ